MFVYEHVYTYTRLYICIHIYIYTYIGSFYIVRNTITGVCLVTLQNARYHRSAFPYHAALDFSPVRPTAHRRSVCVRQLWSLWPITNAVCNDKRRRRRRSGRSNFARSFVKTVVFLLLLSSSSSLWLLLWSPSSTAVFESSFDRVPVVSLTTHPELPCLLGLLTRLTHLARSSSRNSERGEMPYMVFGTFRLRPKTEHYAPSTHRRRVYVPHSWLRFLKRSFYRHRTSLRATQFAVESLRRRSQRWAFSRNVLDSPA